MFWKYQSLFAVKISLFLFLGNLRKTPDEPLEICSRSAAKAVPNFAKFPVNFPVLREWGGRPVRSGLPHQPTSPPWVSPRATVRARPPFFVRVLGAFAGLPTTSHRDPHSLWASTGPISPQGPLGGWHRAGIIIAVCRPFRGWRFGTLQKRAAVQ